MMSSQLRRKRLEIADHGDVAIVNFLERKIIDEPEIQKIGEDLHHLIDEQGHKNILLNFSNVELFSSAAFGKLISLNKKVVTHGGKLVLCGIASDIYEVFVSTRLHTFFNIQEDESAALKEF